MRQLKFRAWDGEKMQDRCTLLVDISDGALYDNRADDYIEWPLMQYTGLKDKNGKDIYEGDILAFDAKEWYRCSDERFDKDYLFEVSQSETGEWIGAGICTEWSTYCEVISNIYENQDLLK